MILRSNFSSDGLTENISAKKKEETVAMIVRTNKSCSEFRERIEEAESELKGVGEERN